MGVNGVHYPMIIHHIPRYIPFTGVQERADYGKRFWMRSYRGPVWKQGRIQLPVMAWWIRKVSKQHMPVKNGALMGEKTKGRKRHIVVDTLGCLLAVVVHAANIHDTKSGILPAKKAVEKYPSLERFCADAGYRKSFEEAVQDQLGLGVDITEKIKPHAWEKLPWRWVVERTFSWLGHSRRLAKDYEITVQSAETMIRISHLHTLLRRW